jgi:glycosyltransferase involved in cell wall biosynthesis
LDQKLNRERSIYIGKIESRKQQHKYKTLRSLDFYGRCDDPIFEQLPCYKGEPSRSDLISNLTNYGNLVLLSTGENGTPLVIKEALMAGLPIVTNKYSANDLDLSLPFIDIIPDEKLDDFVYIQRIIDENREKQVFHREIRDYAVTLFSWENLVLSYLSTLDEIIL